MRRAVFACALGTLLVVPNAASAETPPSVWERVAQPRATRRYDVHVRARELMALDSPMSLEAMRTLTLERARLLLEQNGAEKSPDVRLRFDIGEVYELLERHERAAAILDEALAIAPDHPAAAHAYLMLAYARGRLDQPEAERVAYVRYLERATDPRSRATAVLNLAETEMRLGRLKAAVAGYRHAIELAAGLPPSSDAASVGILATWGLAVALDRSGDPAASSEAARRATSMDPDEALIGRGPNVFFVPPYERLWYLALGAIVHAEDARETNAAAAAWARVEQLWEAYIAQAKATDRWVPLARAHLAKAKREHARYERGGAPPAKAPPDAVDDEP